MIAEFEIDAGDIQHSSVPSAGDLIGTGWQEVTVNLSAYEGQTIRIDLWAGNTQDTNYPSWAILISLLKRLLRRPPPY